MAAPPQCPHEIAFTGNTALSDRVLKKAAAQELTAFGENACRRADIDDAAFQMETAYRAKGYAFAGIYYNIAPSPETTAVIFEVTEGPQVTVEAVRLSGNAHMDEQSLMAMFHWQNTSAGDSPMPVFTQAELDEAISSMEAAYIANGFLDVAIAAPTLEFSETRNRVTVTATITEGTRYVIKEIRTILAPGAKPADCSPTLCTELIDQPYYRRKKALLRSALVSSYRNRGYAWAAVDVAETDGSHPGDIILTATITPGPQVRIDGIVIKGNTKTREAFIRSRIQLRPESLYSEEKERDSFQELYRTGLFSTIDMDLEPAAEHDRATLVVTVTEASLTELYIEPGWGSYELLRLKVGARQRNLFGTGIIFNPEAAVSVKDDRLTLRLTDPWFLNTSLTADLPAYYHYREEPSFTRKDIGFSATLSRAFGHHWKGSAGYGLRKTDITDQATLQQIDPAPTNYDLGSMTVQATRDTRNDIFFPTSGHRLFLAAEHADSFFGSSITLSRLTGGWRYFLPVAKTTVIGLRYTGGIVLPGPSDVTLPISELFFNGGGNSVRSFTESQLGPRDTNGDPVGGYGYNTVNVELRQRLYGNLIGSVFYDVGNVSPNQTRDARGLAPYTSNTEVISDTLETFFEGFRYGIGAGLMYVLPIGPLRADLAFNPGADTDRGESAMVFHFSIGAAF